MVIGYVPPKPAATKVKVTGEFFNGTRWLFWGEYEFHSSTTLVEIGECLHAAIESEMCKSLPKDHTRFTKIHTI